MATSLDELLAVFSAVQAATAEARGQAEEATTTTRALTEEAAGHGWEGVVATMGSVAAALETSIGMLSSADEATQGAGSLLQGISGDVSSRDVHERLQSSVPELEKGVHAIQGALTATEEATGGAETAGEPAGLLAVLHGLHETLTGALGQLNDCREKVETEVATAGGWGN